MTCPRCSDCVGYTHHWMPDSMDPEDEEYEPGDFACKHCDQRGDECPECLGEGCKACDGEGVIPITHQQETPCTD
jgi:hypothetical protein